MGVGESDLVFLHSGVSGIGYAKDLLGLILNTFSRLLPKGTLIVPTFTYNWSQGEEFEVLKTACKDLGALAKLASTDPRFIRLNHPLFSVAALQNSYNADLIRQLFDIDRSCFSKNSFFGNFYRISKQLKAWILLFGGAFTRSMFEATQVHFVQEEYGCLHRLHKKIYNPKNSSEFFTCFGRMLNLGEYQQVHPGRHPNFPLPALEDYSENAKDLVKLKLMVRAPLFASVSRMVRVDQFCDLFREKSGLDPYYCLKG